VTFIPLSNVDVASVAVFVLLSGLLSVWLSLGIERQIFVASVRMVIQLLAVGAVLTFLFGVVSPLWTGAMVLAMSLFACREIAARQHRRFAGIWGYGLGGAAMTVAAGALTLVALLGVLQPAPWYDPRFMIPMFGIILGNTMTGISLGLDTLTQAAVRERAAIEARIALGATRFEALQPTMRESMRRGLMPMINAMAAAGVVSLPGTMTGQILAGIEPGQAVRYQLLIMFLISGATALGLLLAVCAGAYRLTDSRHRLRRDRLRQPK
jgi:putative ABC transport system permease protein